MVFIGQNIPGLALETERRHMRGGKDLVCSFLRSVLLLALQGGNTSFDLYVN